MKGSPLIYSLTSINRARLPVLVMLNGFAHLSRPIAFPAELSIPLYNPDRPHVTLNPNVPIGAVVCVIYNPMHIKDLGFDNKELYKLYPSRIPLESESDALLYGRKNSGTKGI